MGCRIAYKITRHDYAAACRRSEMYCMQRECCVSVNSRCYNVNCISKYLETPV